MLPHIYSSMCEENQLNSSTQIIRAMVERNQYLAQVPWQPPCCLSPCLYSWTSVCLYVLTLNFPTACLQSNICSHLATEAGFPLVTNIFLVSKLEEHIFISWPLPPLGMTPLSGSLTLSHSSSIEILLSTFVTAVHFLVFSSFFSLLFLFVWSFRSCPKNSCLLSVYFTGGFIHIHGSDTRLYGGSPVPLLRLHTVLCTSLPLLQEPQGWFKPSMF